MKSLTLFVVVLHSTFCLVAAAAEPKPVVAIIGTGDMGVVGGPVTIPIAADDRAAKEEVARIIVEMGLDPVDAGPLRYSRELEAMQRLYGVPFFQRRQAAGAALAANSMLRA